MLKRNLFIIGLIKLAFFIAISCSSQEYTTAKLAIQQSDFIKAAEWLPKAMEIEPNNPEIPIVLAVEIYAKNGQWAEMREMFDRAMGIDPAKVIEVRGTFLPVKESVDNYTDFYWAKEFNSGVEQFKKIQEDSENKLDYLEIAIAHFINASIINPLNDNTYSTLAKCYLDKGDKESAKKAVLASVEINPESFNSNFNAGQILSQIGEGSKVVISYFEKAASLDSSSSSALTRLAQVYYELGRKEESIKVFEDAIKNQEDKILRADLFYNLGVIHNQMLQYEEAEKAYEEAAFLNEEDYEALFGMAVTYKNWADNYREGINDFPQDNDQAYNLYRKAEKKMKAAKIIDIDNSDKYNKEIEKIRFLRGTVE